MQPSSKEQRAASQACLQLRVIEAEDALPVMQTTPCGRTWPSTRSCALPSRAAWRAWRSTARRWCATSWRVATSAFARLISLATLSLEDDADEEDLQNVPPGQHTQVLHDRAGHNIPPPTQVLHER